MFLVNIVVKKAADWLEYQGADNGYANDGMAITSCELWSDVTVSVRVCGKERS